MTVVCLFLRVEVSANYRSLCLRLRHLWACSHSHSWVVIVEKCSHKHICCGRYQHKGHIRYFVKSLYVAGLGMSAIQSQTVWKRWFCRFSPPYKTCNSASGSRGVWSLSLMPGYTLDKSPAGSAERIQFIWMQFSFTFSAKPLQRSTQGCLYNTVIKRNPKQTNKQVSKHLVTVGKKNLVLTGRSWLREGQPVGD